MSEQIFSVNIKTIIYIKVFLFSVNLFLYIAACSTAGTTTMIYSFRVSHYVLIFFFFSV